MVIKKHTTRKKLNIAVTDFPPFVTKKDNKYTGFEVELWEKIAKEIGVNYQYKHTELPNIFKELKTKRADLGFAGLTMNPEREKLVDFSFRTFDSGLHILVPEKSRVSILNTLKSIFNKEIRKIFLILLSFVFITGHVLWFVERGAGAISRSYIPGILESLWWGIVTVSTVGYGDFTPHTWIGRLVGSVVILLGLGIFGLYIARISSLMTIKEIKSDIKEPKDLREKKVATKIGTTSVEILDKVGAKTILVKNIKEAFIQLEKGQIDAIVFDAPVLLHYAKTKGIGKVHIVGDIFEAQSYGFAMTQKNPLHKKINITLLKLRKTGFYDKLYKKWFGSN